MKRRFGLARCCCGAVIPPYTPGDPCSQCASSDSPDEYNVRTAGWGTAPGPYVYANDVSFVTQHFASPCNYNNPSPFRLNGPLTLDLQSTGFRMRYRHFLNNWVHVFKLPASSPLTCIFAGELELPWESSKDGLNPTEPTQPTWVGQMFISL